MSIYKNHTDDGRSRTFMYEELVRSEQLLREANVPRFEPIFDWKTQRGGNAEELYRKTRRLPDGRMMLEEQSRYEPWCGQCVVGLSGGCPACGTPGFAKVGALGEQNVVDRVTPTEGETYAAWCGRVGEPPDARTPMSWAWTVDWGRGSWRPPRSCDRMMGTCPLHAEACPSDCDYWIRSDRVAAEARESGTGRRRPVPPEVGQLWDPRGTVGRDLTDDGLLLVRCVSAGGHVFFKGAATAHPDLLARMRLVGFELPDGRRVMVGDRFLHGGCSYDSEARVGQYEVVEVLPRAAVRLESVGRLGVDLPVAELLAGRLSSEGCVWEREQEGMTDRRRSVMFEVGQILDFPAGSLTPREERAVVRRVGAETAIVVCSDGHNPMVTLSSPCASAARIVGLELHDGRRVVVGDRFENITRYITGDRMGKLVHDGLFRVEEVQEGAHVLMRRVDGPEYRILASSLLDPAFGWVRVNAEGVAVVEISVTANQSQGHVARTVGEYLANYARSYGPSTAREHPLSPSPASRAKPPGYPDRSAVDALLREDARLHPEFAEARRAAVLADFEVQEGGGAPRPRGAGDAARLVRGLHRYESLRGGGREPSAQARPMVEGDPAVAAYESARRLCRLGAQ